MSNHFPAIFLFLVGSVSGGFLVWSLIRQRAIRKWSFTTGKVIESRLNRVSGDSFEPYVKYSYAVQGKGYTNDKILPVNYLTEDENVANKALAPDRANAPVTVYYHPNDPSRSVLEPKNSLWIHIFWAVFTTFFIALGVVALQHKN